MFHEEIDPLKMAMPGDLTCQSVFVRSWIIDPAYVQNYRIAMMEDTQQTLTTMQQDFPNVCDLYTMLIHPSYEPMAAALGFQTTSKDPLLSICSMYLAVDRFLALNIKTALINL